MRLVTRSDFDGLCCAALLTELGVIDDVFYTHPKDLQDGKIEITSNDVLANVPYVEGCGLWFDHHSSEQERLDLNGRFEGRSETAPSAARVIYNYYGGEKLSRFDDMLLGVDKVDSAMLSEQDILEPEDWVLLGYICDPRSGFAYHRKFTLSNFDLMKSLREHLRTKGIDEILALPDVQERIARYRDNQDLSIQFLRAHTRVDGHIAITDTRSITDMPPGNRFLVYPLFPETNISIRLIDGREKKFVVFSVGYSITNRTAKVDVGSLMLKYGGGGHRKVGTCQVSYADAGRVLVELVQAIKAES